MAQDPLTFDIAVIGAGSAGLSVAAAAAQFGERVVLFEKGEMGGDCLNTGCVPSKSLLAAAKRAQHIRDSARFGITAVEPKIDYAGAMRHVASVIATIAPHDSQERFEKLGVTVVREAARFEDPRTISAGGRHYRARRTVIATGSRPAVPPIPGLDQVPYFTSDTIFSNRVRPDHLIVIGAGPIGLEMAQAHRRLGCRVTVLESAQPLPRDDADLAAIVVSTLKNEGVDIRASVQIEKIAAAGEGVTVALRTGEQIAGSHLLLATGRKANIENLNLEAAGIAVQRNGIAVDKGLRTANRAVYAAGDAAGGLQFTHVAGYHAGLIIRNALFRLPVTNSADHIPRVTYTDPELAAVGLSEQAAREKYGGRVKLASWPFSNNDRAQAEGNPEGFVKLVLAPSGKLAGAAIVGPNAGELIAPWCLALSQGLKLSAIAGTVLPYPTMSEAGKRAATSSFAGLATNPWVRRLIGLLKQFG